MSEHRDNTLQRELDELPRELTPERDLWPGIHHAIHREQRRRRGYAPLAAAAVLAVAAGLVLTSQLVQQTPPSTDPAVAALIEQLQSRHEDTKQSLLVGYRDREPWNADWPARMERLEQAEQQIYEAYRANPGNAELLRLLREVQEQQIELINAMYTPGFTRL